MGRIPEEGDAFEAEGILFRVKQMDDRRIDKVEMVLAKPGE